jgi:hypothetical protein
MKALRVVLTVATVVALALPALAQEEGAMTPEMAARMEAWEKAATPGPNHELMASFAGEWTFTATSWMAPDAPPQETTGTMTSKAILGGRFVVDTVHGTMVGQPFEGMGISGFDNVKGKFVSIWVDNMGTGIMTAEGDYDPQTKTMTMIGTFTDPVTGAPKQSRMVTHLETEKRHVMEFFEAGPDGAEKRTMRMIYTRE